MNLIVLFNYEHDVTSWLLISVVVSPTSVASFGMSDHLDFQRASQVMKSLRFGNIPVIIFPKLNLNTP